MIGKKKSANSVVSDPSTPMGDAVDSGASSDSGSPAPPIHRSDPVNVTKPRNDLMINNTASAASSRKSSASTTSWFSWAYRDEDKDAAWYGKLFSKSSNNVGSGEGGGAAPSPPHDQHSTFKTETAAESGGPSDTKKLSGTIEKQKQQNHLDKEQLANSSVDSDSHSNKQATSSGSLTSKLPSFTGKIRSSIISTTPKVKEKEREKDESTPSTTNNEHATAMVTSEQAKQSAVEHPAKRAKTEESQDTAAKQSSNVKTKEDSEPGTRTPTPSSTPSDSPALTGQTPQQQHQNQNQHQRQQSQARSWAFWSRSSNANGPGEMAVSDTSTETAPEATQNNNTTANSASTENATITEDTADSSATNNKPKKTSKKEKEKEKEKVVRPNLVTPTLDESFEFDSPPSLLMSGFQRLSRLIMPEKEKVSFSTATNTTSPSASGSIFTSSGTKLHQIHDHVYRCSPVRIKKVVVVGVHGYFPARVLRKFLGEPTGTSVKFSNEAARAVERWADEKGYTVQIDKIALEGEGRVLKRVNKLYTLLSNWMHLIEEADFVFFAAHSQGTPVAVHLLARLVEEGRVEKKKLALLGMAGVCIGPMSGLDQTLFLRAYSSIESDSLSELFEFQKTDGLQARKFVESLRTIIAHDTKIVFVGSVDDQLVPLYSSTCVHVSHPNIYRAAYIDGEDVAPEFLSTLLGIVFRLRNIGSIDHGVVKEISGALAGALTGAGHSKIYNEPAVYDLTLRFALETTSGYSSVPLRVDEPAFTVPKASNHNPYLLPWAVRGLLEEAQARPELFGDQLALLYEEFDAWRPSTKSLKDVKYRLSAIQSKL